MAKTKPHLITQIQRVSLYQWNLVLAVIYAAQAIAFGILSNGYSLPITTNYLTLDPLVSQAARHEVFVGASSQIFSFNLAYLVVVILAISALGHLLVATRYRLNYENNIKKGVSKLRAIELAISLNLMVILVALVVGLHDLSSLIMLVSITLLLSLLILVIELRPTNLRKVSKLDDAISILAAVVPWIVIIIYIISGIIYGNHLSAASYWLVGSMLALFILLGVNLGLQQHHYGRWADYLYGERIQLLLVLATETALTWQIFALIGNK